MVAEPIRRKRAIIYVRVSDPKQERAGTSLDTQEQRCRAWCAEHDADVVRVFREVHTGQELWQRPELTKARAMVKDGETDILVAYAVDRLARDPVHLGVILTDAEPKGVTVEFVNEPLETSTESDLLSYVKAWAAKIEAAKITERTQRGLMEKVARGRPLVGTRARYGYRWADAAKTTRVIEPSQAAIVADLFDQVAVGRALRRLAADLDERGISTPSGRGSWRAGTIRHIIRDPIYKGEAAAFRQRSFRGKDGKRYQRYVDPSEWVPLVGDETPAIVSADVWASANLRLPWNKQASPRRALDPNRSLLRSGFVRCGWCGRNMGVIRTKRRLGSDYYSYSCLTKSDRPNGCRGAMISAKRLDADVWAYVREAIANPRILLQRLECIAEDDPTDSERESYWAELAKLEAAEANLASNLGYFAPDSASAAAIRGQLALVVERRERLLADLGRLEAARGDWQRQRDGLADLKRALAELGPAVDGLSYDQKRQALSVLDVQVAVWGRGHDPVWRATADPSAIAVLMGPGDEDLTRFRQASVSNEVIQ